MGSVSGSNENYGTSAPLRGEGGDRHIEQDVATRRAVGRPVPSDTALPDDVHVSYNQKRQRSRDHCRELTDATATDARTGAIRTARATTRFRHAIRNMPTCEPIISNNNIGIIMNYLFWIFLYFLFCCWGAAGGLQQ